MLKLFETGEAESLLPVVGAVLQFSPAEMERCRAALHQRQAALAASNVASECGPRCTLLCPRQSGGRPRPLQGGGAGCRQQAAGSRCRQACWR